MRAVERSWREKLARSIYQRSAREAASLQGYLLLNPWNKAPIASLSDTVVPVKAKPRLSWKKNGELLRARNHGDESREGEVSTEGVVGCTVNHASI